MAEIEYVIRPGAEEKLRQLVVELYWMRERLQLGSTAPFADRGGETLVGTKSNTLVEGRPSGASTPAGAAR